MPTQADGGKTQLVFATPPDDIHQYHEITGRVIQGTYVRNEM